MFCQQLLFYIFLFVFLPPNFFVVEICCGASQQIILHDCAICADAQLCVLTVAYNSKFR